jgi:hypothetical protein
MLQDQASEQLHSNSITPVEAIAQAPQFVQQSHLQELADHVRETDLAIVATHLGLKQDHCDKHKWRDAEHIISIDGSKFMNWAANKGGGGAIDLVMHVQQIDFKAAVQWLSGLDLTAQPLIIRKPLQLEDRYPRSLDLPVPNEQRWLAVQDYLVETRKLPVGWVDRLHEKNLIYADDDQKLHQPMARIRMSGWCVMSNPIKLVHPHWTCSSCDRSGDGIGQRKC